MVLMNDQRERDELARLSSKRPQKGYMAWDHKIWFSISSNFYYKELGGGKKIRVKGRDVVPSNFILSYFIIIIDFYIEQKWNEMDLELLHVSSKPIHFVLPTQQKAKETKAILTVNHFQPGHHNQNSTFLSPCYYYTHAGTTTTSSSQPHYVMFYPEEPNILYFFVTLSNLQLN